MSKSDIIESLEKALIRDDWIYGDRWNRIGSPFVWIDGDHQSKNILFMSGRASLFQALSMYYEEYITPPEIMTNNHNNIWTDFQNVIEDLINSYLGPEAGKPYYKYGRLMALARAQDYCFIKKFCTELKIEPSHLDLGPGVGTHCLYVTCKLKGRYVGVEASPYSYENQRLFFRHMEKYDVGYFDPIVAESIGVPIPEIKELILNSTKQKDITHVPSWFFEVVPTNSQDLVTATFMLNEVGPAGIIWLLSNAIRCLKVGGYFYIRDSTKLKPNRHALNYDDVLIETGFELVKKLDVKNRVDLYGIPRVYKKISEVGGLEFETFFNRYFGRESVTVHEGGYMQNLPKKMHQNS